MHIATALLQQVPGVTTDNLRIVDDGPELLHAWKTRTRDVGMTHLRSSASNHLDVREDALRRYAEKTFGRQQSRPGKKSVFASDYMRPRLDRIPRPLRRRRGAARAAGGPRPRCCR